LVSALLLPTVLSAAMAVTLTLAAIVTMLDAALLAAAMQLPMTVAAVVGATGMPDLAVGMMMAWVPAVEVAKVGLALAKATEVPIEVLQATTVPLTVCTPLQMASLFVQQGTGTRLNTTSCDLRVSAPEKTFRRSRATAFSVLASCPRDRANCPWAPWNLASCLWAQWVRMARTMRKAGPQFPRSLLASRRCALAVVFQPTGKRAWRH